MYLWWAVAYGLGFVAMTFNDDPFFRWLGLVGLAAAVLMFVLPLRPRHKPRNS